MFNCLTSGVKPFTSRIIRLLHYLHRWMICPNVHLLGHSTNALCSPELDLTYEARIAIRRVAPASSYYAVPKCTRRL
jgi:hypothetical protein